MKRKLLNILRAMLLFLIPQVHFGQAPNLGTTSNFALFTSIGAFTNVGGGTLVVGDIGTNAGALTGFPPGILTGTKHVENAVSAQAAVDVDVAYNDLSAVSCGTNLVSPLGSGQTLTPGVYCLGTATALDGTLILDGQGNPNALFIFKINGAFSTSTSSDVTLINGACWCNVYWQITGAVELGANSSFSGTIVANGAISLMEGASLQGRGLSRPGAISLQNNVVTLSGPLPIDLVYFHGRALPNAVELFWQTAAEKNNAYMAVERSGDGLHFVEIGQVKPANGPNSSVSQVYKLVDTQPLVAINYYRLRQVDLDEKHTYHLIIAVDYNGKTPSNITLQTNLPEGGQIQVFFNEFLNGQATLVVVDLNGRIVQQATISADTAVYTVNTTQLSTGYYTVQVQTRTTRDAIQFIKM